MLRLCYTVHLLKSTSVYPWSDSSSFKLEIASRVTYERKDGPSGSISYGDQTQPLLKVNISPNFWYNRLIILFFLKLHSYYLYFLTERDKAHPQSMVALGNFLIPLNYNKWRPWWWKHSILAQKFHLFSFTSNIFKLINPRCFICKCVYITYHIMTRDLHL